MKDIFKIFLLAIFLIGCEARRNHSSSDKTTNSQLKTVSAKRLKEKDRNINELYLNTTPKKKGDTGC